MSSWLILSCLLATRSSICVVRWRKPDVDVLCCLYEYGRVNEKSTDNCWTQFCHWRRCSVSSSEVFHPSVTKPLQHLLWYIWQDPMQMHKCWIFSAMQATLDTFQFGQAAAVHLKSIRNVWASSSFQHVSILYSRSSHTPGHDGVLHTTFTRHSMA